MPALSVALLTRRLSPSCYGRLIIAQSLGFTVSTFTEYGFRWTGSRAVAENPTGANLGLLVSAINAAKLLIAAPCALLIPISMLCIPSVSGYPLLVTGGYIWGVLQGLALQWYFMGRERLRAYLSVDTLMRACAVAFILALIHDDRDVSKVLLIQVACTLCLFIWAIRRVGVDLKLVIPSKHAIVEVMRDGGTLFLQQLARYSTGTVNIAILGMVSSPAHVGFFGCADKLVRYLSSLSAPITQFVYPKISRKAAASSHQRATRLANLAGGISVAIGAGVSVIVFAIPKLIILLLYGKRMLPALPALRILAIFPLLNAMTTSIVYYWLLPLRMERSSLRVLVVAGIINILSIALLGKVWNETGAAAAVTITEIITLLGYLLAMRSTKASESNKFNTLTKEAI